LTQQIKKLTLPHEMGELFKVLALGRGVREPLPGFTLQDRRGRL
jgi:SAM-dependent MidA family methyltransferase